MTDDDLAEETPFGQRDAVAGAAHRRQRPAAQAGSRRRAERGPRPAAPARAGPLVDALVPSAVEQAARYADAITAELIAAAEAGAASITGMPDTTIDLSPTGPLEPVRASMSGDLVEPLRQRLEAAVDDGDGDNDAITKRVRAVYREWKTQRIDEQLDDLFHLAYAPRSHRCVAARDRRAVGRRSQRAAITRLRGQRTGRCDGARSGVPVGPPVAPDAPRVPLPPARDRRVASRRVRRASDLPRRRGARRRISGRAILITLGVLFLVVVVFGRALARFYIDYLWHDGLGRADVFWGVLRAKATLFGMFFGAFAVLAGLNLLDRRQAGAESRSPPTPTPTSSGSTSCSGTACGCCATSPPSCWPIIVALPTTSQWQ